MSLTVNSTGGSSFSPIPEGSHLAVCYMLVDLGVQENKTFNNRSRKVMIGWELPDETYESDGKQLPRTIRNTYTASLNESSNLRRDLAAWRGRDFTQDELDEFNLRNIMGTSCLINVIHKERNGRTYANIASIMALPKGMQKGKIQGDPIIFDLDDATMEDIGSLPDWIATMVKSSITYQEKLSAMYSDDSDVSQLTELEDDGELPF